MRSFGTKGKFVTGALLSAITANAAAQRVIFVNVNAPGMNNGTSWLDAYKDIQDALDYARQIGGCPCEIWIAGGTYKPDRGTGDRSMSFEMVDDTTLYGGFGGHETDPSQRDCISNETILDGDLNGDDDWELLPTSSCCSTHYEPGCDNSECAAAVSPYWSRCVTALWSVSCVGLSESLCCDLCRPTRCDNSYHVLRVLAGASVTIDGLTVANGEAHGPDVSDARGAGLYAPGADTNLTIRNCIFQHNMPDAIYAYDGESELTDTLVTENGNSHRTGTDGPDASTGPIVHLNGSNGIIQSTSFVRNGGGGLSTATNQLVDGCLFEENHGFYCLQVSSSPLIRNCIFRDNDRTTVEAGIYHPTFLNCQFIGNWNADKGPTMTGDGFITLENCIFDGNWAAGRSDPNTLGGSSAISATSIFMRNCTVTGNVSGGETVGASSYALIESSVFWKNKIDVGVGAGIYADTAEINYSIIQGQTERYPGVGNLDVDPMFVDPLGPDGIAGTEDDDLRLSPWSPAINAGDPNIAPSAGDTDLDGHARILCGRIDMGPFETGMGDYDCNQAVNKADFAAWANCFTDPMLDNSQPSYAPSCSAFDFDADGDVDLKDFYGLQQIFVTP